LVFPSFFNWPMYAASGAVASFGCTICQNA
jgi:hypothetical protein